MKLGDFIPKNERWLHEPGFESDLDEALEWAAQNPPGTTSLAELERLSADDDNPGSK